MGDVSQNIFTLMAISFLEMIKIIKTQNNKNLVKNVY
jgi:hypothetical protein